MKILLITQWYKPIKAAAAKRTSRIAQHLTSRGHKVTVLTGMPSYPTGILEKKYRGKIYLKEKIDSVDVLRVYEYPAPNQGVFKRLLNNLTFMFSASIAAFCLEKHDAVIVSSPSFLSGIPGLIARAIGAKFYFDVRDLWPDSAIELGFVKEHSLLGQFLKFLERTYYKKAEKIFTATPSIRKHLILEGVNPQKLGLLLNTVDTEYFTPKPVNKETFGYKQSDFVVAYTGIHGPAQGLDYTLQAAKILKDKTNIKFLFVGEGEEKEKLIDFATKNNLENVTFLSEKPREEIIDVINMADAGLVPLAPQKIFQEAMPSKSHEYLACAKPVIAGCKGDLKQYIDSYDAGITYEADDAQSQADAIFTLSKDKNIAQKGKNARKLAQKEFSDQIFYQKLDEVFGKKITR